VPTGQVFMPASASGEITVSLRTSDASSGESQFLSSAANIWAVTSMNQKPNCQSGSSSSSLACPRTFGTISLRNWKGALSAPKGQTAKICRSKGSTQRKLRVFLDRLLAKHKARIWVAAMIDERFVLGKVDALFSHFAKERGGLSTPVDPVQSPIHVACLTSNTDI